VKFREIESEPIVGRLLAAFADTGPPGTKALPSYPDFEAMAVVRLLRKRIWDDLEAQELLDRASALNWLRRGFALLCTGLFCGCYRLPGGGRRCRVRASPKFCPSRSTCDQRRPVPREMAEGLTTTQKAVIRDCLRGLGLYLDAELSRCAGETGWRMRTGDPRTIKARGRTNPFWIASCPDGQPDPVP